MFVVLQGAQVLSSCQEESGTDEQSEWQLCRNTGMSCDLYGSWANSRSIGNPEVDKSGTDYRSK